jgi:hypothetical protein
MSNENEHQESLNEKTDHGDDCCGQERHLI